MIRVLICDDHLIVRQGIKQILADAPDITLAGEAANGPDAMALVRASAAWPPEGAHAGALQRDGAPVISIDVVLLDIAMPQRDGLDILKALKSEFPKLPVLMLSTYPDRQYAVRSLKLGAAGYLNKSADSEQLIEAIRKVAKGQLFITQSVAEQLAGAMGAGSGGLKKGQGNDEAPLHERLSHREYQVFRLLAGGRSVGEIAEQLVLSPNTVSTYRTRILEKTGVRNDVELALYAVQQDLLQV
jgi:two-component system invasion response regulator UvrY